MLGVEGKECRAKLGGMKMPRCPLVVATTKFDELYEGELPVAQASWGPRA